MGIFSSMSSMVSGMASSLSSSVTSAVKSKASSVIGSVSSKLKSGDISGLASEGLSLYNEGNSLYDKGKSLYGKAKDLLNTDKDDDEKESKKKKGSKSDKESDKADDSKSENKDREGDKLKAGKSKDEKEGAKGKIKEAASKTKTFVFAFEIDGIECANFQKCEGLSLLNEVLEVPVGGENTTTPKFYGNTKYGNVVLSNGLVKSGNDLLEWLQGSLTSTNLVRKSCSLILKSLAGDEVGRWNIYGAIPVGWNIPVGGACADGKFSTDLVEKIEIAIDRYEYIKAS